MSINFLIVILSIVCEGSMSGKFEIYKDSAGEFRFRLKAANGQNILASEGYTAKANCENGIDSVKPTLLTTLNMKGKRPLLVNTCLT